MRDGLPSDMEYLANGASNLLSGVYAGHTSRDVHQQCNVPIKAKDGSAGNLTIPDCSGEKFNQIYEKREWGSEWDDLIVEGTGCLLFVRANSDQVVAPLDWITFHQLFTTRKGESHHEGGSNGETVAPAANGDTTLASAKQQPEGVGHSVEPVAASVPLAPAVDAPASSESSSPLAGVDQPKGQVRPTQVVLVEWLQFLRQVYTAKVGYNYRPRIGIVVSAWDLVPNDQQAEGPSKYLDANFPLLAQFIESNRDRFDIQCFGVSVTGGDLDNMPGYKQQYIDGNPQNAGFVLHEINGKPEQVTDHTLPVAWALGAWPEQTK